jgi:hypothetical protein
VYRHEHGFDVYADYDMLPWAETFPINENSGAKLSTLYQLFPEVSGDADAVEFVVIHSDSRSRNREEIEAGPFPIRDNGYVDVRVKNRDKRIRVQPSRGGDWSIGQIGVDLRGGGTK